MTRNREVSRHCFLARGKGTRRESPGIEPTSPPPPLVSSSFPTTNGVGVGIGYAVSASKGVRTKERKKERKKGRKEERKEKERGGEGREKRNRGEEEGTGGE